MNTEKKLQVVTGGTSGMGLSTALALGKFGPVLIGGRNEKRLANAMEQLRAAGVEVYGKTCDIADRTSIDEFAKYAASLGTIGNVVNAAGVDAGGPELIMKINFLGTINVTEAFFPYMEKARLVHYSSITGYFYRPTPEDMAVWNEPNAPDFLEKLTQVMATKKVDAAMAHMGSDYAYYSASKRFVMYYTQANTTRFGKKGCQVFSIAPGAFDTPMLREQDDNAVGKVAKGTAFGRLGDPDEMADFIVHLLEPGHDYLTGCDLVLDGGKSGMVLAKQLP